MNVLKAVFGGFLAAVGAILAYMVYQRVKDRKVVPAPDTSRVPGQVGDLNDSFGGFFRTGDPLAVPPVIGPYGAVGSPVYGMEGFTPVTLDNNVPEFLIGATGGVQDPEMPGTAPPIILGNPGVIGGRTWSPEYHNPGIRVYYKS